MRKWISVIVTVLLLAGGVVLCAVRWQAWFGVPPAPKWTGDTINYVFSLPSADSIQPSELTVLVLGDVHNRLTREDYDSLAARVPQRDLVAQTGDWLERGQDYYYRLLLREWTESALAGTPVIACPGNHEYSKGLQKSLSPVWENAFNQATPESAVYPIEDVPGASCYIDLQDVRFIVIDTNPLVRLVWLTRTLTWLREAMYSAGNRYVVVLMHHPVLSPGKGRFNPLIYATFRHALSEADLVIAGHDHSYMRRTPFVVLNTAGKTKPQLIDFPVEATDTVPVYGVLTVNRSGQPCDEAVRRQSGMTLTIHRMSDGTAIDSLHVSHD